MANLRPTEEFDTKQIVHIRALDLVFISFDEPQAEEHWLDLKRKCPDAMRVHGIEGLDRAHKAAAERASSEFFLTVDGDTVVEPAFFDQVLDRTRLGSRSLITWPSRNPVNGLKYGNGSIKCWPRDAVMTMRSHEAARTGDPATFDFADLFDRTALSDCFSETTTNGSAEQAFRTALREGVKLSLVKGESAGLQLTDRISNQARRRLQVWCSIGSDARNGLWSMYGARLGCVLACLRDWDCSLINDYRAVRKLWAGAEGQASDWQLLRTIRKLGDEIRERLDLAVIELSPEQSRFHKDVSQELDTAAEPPLAIPSASTCGVALDRLGTLHRRGLGVPQDLFEAARLYRIADSLGCRNGTKNLALMYRDGQGVVADRAQAISLLQVAAAAGSPDAPYLLAELIGGAESRELDLIKLSASRNHIPAIRRLGELMEQRNQLSQAADYYVQAAELGDAEAERRSRRLKARLGQHQSGDAKPSLSATG